jgi:hypothetical protein
MMTSDLTPRVDVPALFLPEGGRLVPSAFAVGPWRPDALHGGAIAALFAAALELEDRALARVTVDLLAAVPLRPLRLEVNDEGGGRKVQRRSAVLWDEERAVARASALYVTPVHQDLPREDEAVIGPPADLAPLPESRAGWPGFESLAMALHTVGGGEKTTSGWFRLLVPAIAGELATGMQSALAAADYTSGGTARLLSLKKWMFMSLDLTVNVVRQPGGDWIGLNGERSTLGKDGIGVAGALLYDASGSFGRCVQTQLLQSLAPLGTA